MEKVIVTARIDGQIHRDLKKVAEREERSMSYLVRKAVTAYVKEMSGVGAVSGKKTRRA